MKTVDLNHYFNSDDESSDEGRLGAVSARCEARGAGGGGSAARELFRLCWLRTRPHEPVRRVVTARHNLANPVKQWRGGSSGGSGVATDPRIGRRESGDAHSLQ